jgi:hypothetical protein
MENIQNITERRGEILARFPHSKTRKNAHVIMCPEGNHNPDFLLHDLPNLLEDAPLAVRARMWYMHEGAPAHFSRAVRDVLNIMTDG